MRIESVIARAARVSGFMSEANIAASDNQGLEARSIYDFGHATMRMLLALSEMPGIGEDESNHYVGEAQLMDHEDEETTVAMFLKAEAYESIISFLSVANDIATKYGAIATQESLVIQYDYNANPGYFYASPIFSFFDE